MVYTRRKNAKADANTNKTVFIKEQNDLFIQKDKKSSLYEKGEQLNSFVLSLNEKAYCSMSLRFHPDKNIHEDASKMMRIINEAKEGLKITLRNNDAIREAERVRMAEETIHFRLMTILIQKQEMYHRNQQLHLIKHPHFQLNPILKMKKHP